MVGRPELYDSEPNEKGERENTWLNGVVPAWKILEMLELPELKEHHELMESRIVASLKRENESDVSALAVAAEPPDVMPAESERPITAVEDDNQHK